MFNVDSMEVERYDQSIKSLFMYTFINWARVYIEDHIVSMIDFIDWFLVK